MNLAMVAYSKQIDGERQKTWDAIIPVQSMGGSLKEATKRIINNSITDGSLIYVREDRLHNENCVFYFRDEKYEHMTNTQRKEHLDEVDCMFMYETKEKLHPMRFYD